MVGKTEAAEPGHLVASQIPPEEHAFRALTPTVAGKLSAAGRVTNMDCVLQGKSFSQCCEIVDFSYNFQPPPSAL